MDRSKVILLFNTLKYLRLKQFYYRIYYFLKNNIFKTNIKDKTPFIKQKLNWDSGIESLNSYDSGLFTFLNKNHKFNNLNWNFSNYGKLWTYNLNYFDFLNQKDISKKEGLSLIYDYIKKRDYLIDGLEPYPTSLRIINWIKFISLYSIKDKKIDNILFNHLIILNKNIEYHLLGNHLLENAFSLLFGSYYFKDKNIYKISKKLLLEELEEQILDDGAHFELSPMYHQILLIKVLDCIQLINNNSWQNDNLLDFMKNKAILMLSWLDSITYKNNSIPHINDSAFSITPNLSDIFMYAKKLGIQWTKTKLSISGFRKWNNGYAEIFMDFSIICANYIPGHSHADTFNFEFYYKGQPIIIDMGISTYEKNSRRQLERSTKSHNTICLDNKNSSEVWGGFRVARRAKIINLKEEKNKIIATHDGYKRIGALHTRTFKKLDNKLIIEDQIQSNKSHTIESFLHFHPDCNINIKKNKININSEITILYSCYKNLLLEDYDYPIGYNKWKKALKLRALVEKESKIEINYEN